ncbi:MAG: MFS transporter [Rhizobiaceae bacterium]|nr:MFS transporter [Rhizobiaceae bacterium]
MATILGRGRQPWRLLSLALAMLLPSLGTSIANVALPSLESAFGASFGEVQWVVLSYLLAVTALIVIVGRLGDLLGRRRLLLAGIGIFALASAGAAAAPGLGALIAARAIQGLGAATMMALAVASVGDVVPAQRMGSAMGLLGTVSAAGTALGPSLGGVLLAWAGWPAVFAAMAGAAAATFLIGIRMLPATPAGSRKTGSFDFPGMLLLATSVGAFALSATLGGGRPGLLNAGLAALFVVAIAAFVVVERHTASPLVRIELLREPVLGSGLLALGLVSTIVMATLVVGPFYLSETLGLGPVQLGLVMSVGPGVAALSGLPAGRLVDVFGSARVQVAGLSGVTVGAALMAILPGLSGTAGYIGGLVVITAGYALFQAANNTAVMANATPDRRGLASALLGLARNLGLVTGASAMGAVFAIASGGVAFLHLPAGRQTGLALTFGLGALLAAAALLVVVRNQRQTRP